MNRAKTLAQISVMVALALVLHVVERMLPIPQVAPGIKLGLANVVTLVALFVMGFRQVVSLVIVRTLLASFFGGGVTEFLFSVTGGMLSLLVMYLAVKKLTRYFSLPSISVLGAIAHNCGQLLIAALIVETFSIFTYLPVLMVSAAVTGTVVGITAKAVLSHLVRAGWVPLTEELKMLI